MQGSGSGAPPVSSLTCARRRRGQVIVSATAARWRRKRRLPQLLPLPARLLPCHSGQGRGAALRRTRSPAEAASSSMAMRRREVPGSRAAPW